MDKKDLTAGAVGKQLIVYALPMITTSLFQSLYSIVDIMITGHYVGDTGVSAINNAGLIINLMTQIAIGFTMGGNVLISQYFGAKKKQEQGRATWTLLLSSMLGGILFFAFLFFLARPMLQLLKAPSLAEAEQYLRVGAIGMLFVFGYNGISSLLRALGNSKTPMYFVIISTLLNIGLDFFLVAGLDMGVYGAALATVIAQIVSCLLALIYICRYSREYLILREYFGFDGKMAVKIAKLGFPMALQWTVASISWLGVAFLINQYGVVVSAGNGISNKIKDFCQLFISAVASAGATMAAQNLGAGLHERAKQVMWYCMRINIGIALVMILFNQLFAPNLVGLFIEDPATIAAGAQNLRIEIIAQLFYAGFLTFNVLAIGCGDTLFVLGNSFLNCIVVRLILAFLLEAFFGITGVYVACMIAPFVSVPVGYAYYRSGKWKRKCD